MKRTIWLPALFTLFAAPALAQAADGYVTANVNLRAGPDIDYPRVDTIPAGDSVDIYGCTDGWEWCDVAYRGDRGWVAGNYIETIQNDRYAPLPQYGAQFGIPIVTFVISSYWSNYYSRQPFYRERHRWYQRPIPRRPAPPPPHRPWHRSGTPPWAQTGGPIRRPEHGPDTYPLGGQRPKPGTRPPVTHPSSGTRPHGDNPQNSGSRSGGSYQPSQGAQRGHEQDRRTDAQRPDLQPTPQPHTSGQAQPRPSSITHPAPAAHPARPAAPAKGKPADTSNDNRRGQ